MLVPVWGISTVEDGPESREKKRVKIVFNENITLSIQVSLSNQLESELAVISYGILQGMRFGIQIPVTLWFRWGFPVFSHVLYYCYAVADRRQHDTGLQSL